MDIHPDFLKHIEPFDQLIKDRFLSICAHILKYLPNAEEKLGYGVPGFFIQGKIVLYVACFKHHIGMYPGSEFIAKHEADLKAFKTFKGTIQISHQQEIPFDIIKAILVDRGFVKHD